MNSEITMQMEWPVVAAIPWHKFLSRTIVTGLSQSMTSMSQKCSIPNQILRLQATKENPENLDNAT